MARAQEVEIANYLIAKAHRDITRELIANYLIAKVGRHLPNYQRNYLMSHGGRENCSGELGAGVFGEAARAALRRQALGGACR